MTHVFPFCRRALLTAAALLALAGTGYAQLPGAPAAGTITAKLMPLALADPWTPTFRAGAEYRLSAGWGVEASYGLQMRNLGWGADQVGRLNDHFQKTHAELRRYFPGSPFYVAAAGFQVRQRYDVGAGSLYQHDQTWTYSSARVRRDVLGGVVKAGVVLPLDRRWRLDIAAGAGIRRVRVAYAMREPQVYTPQAVLLDCDPKCGFAVDLSPTTAPGTSLRPTVALDIRLGYELSR